MNGQISPNDMMLGTWPPDLVVRNKLPNLDIQTWRDTDSSPTPPTSNKYSSFWKRRADPVIDAGSSSMDGYSQARRSFIPWHGKIERPVRQNTSAHVLASASASEGFANPEDATPNEVGTPQAFGGTSGKIEQPNPADLPDPLPVQKVGPSAKVPRKGEEDPQEIAGRNLSVLNRETVFTTSDYEKIMLGKEAEKLQEFGQQANYELKRAMEAQRFYNLSLSDVARNTAMTMIAVMVDLLNLSKETSGENYQEKASRVALIFLKEDRMIYVGVFFVLLSLLFMVVFLSS